MRNRSSRSAAAEADRRSSARSARRTNSIRGASSANAATSARRNSRTAQYVAPDVTGYEDLDDNGTWSSEAEYGYVWTPTSVAVGWSPYHDGRWAWVAPWGWTWIDDAPWGYAPFHYGRWAHVRNRWCWVPGPRHVARFTPRRWSAGSARRAQVASRGFRWAP